MQNVFFSKLLILCEKEFSMREKQTVKNHKIQLNLSDYFLKINRSVGWWKTTFTFHSDLLFWKHSSYEEEAKEIPETIEIKDFTLLIKHKHQAS